MSRYTDWPLLLAQETSWMQLYPVIGYRAREILCQLPEGAQMRTKDLAMKLWPEGVADPRCQFLVRRIYRGLAKCADKSLADCRMHGAPRQWYGKTATPIFWHRPIPGRMATASWSARDITLALANLDDGTIAGDKLEELIAAAKILAQSKAA